jgi:NADPH-dependent 2,4-dienoyl-CoA reductase/sulfur reductase-like enzyme/rhodanese-related sulfurtransferase
MAKRRVIVLGGAVSGPTAAARARETDEEADIILIERSRDVSYAACALAYHASGEVPALDALNRQRAEFFWDVYRVKVRTGMAVTGLDTRARAVLVKGGRLPYDSLVYALGADSVLPAVPGLEGARNVFRFRTLLDLEGLLARVDAGARRVAVMGGGFIGVEAADGLARRGCQVTLVEQGERILPAFSRAAGRAAADALRELGVTVVEGARAVRASRTGPDVRALQLQTRRSLAVEAVVAAVGLRPRTELLARAGARLHPDGSVAVDNRCATSLPGVFACGVCVSVPHAVSGEPVWLPQAALADKTAQVAGACAAGGDARIGAALGSAIVRAGALTLGRTGLTREEAARYAGPEAAHARIHAPSLDPFFPASADVQVELLYHRGSGRLLGGEVASRTGADKRVDVLATAILGGLSVRQLASIDLAYAPPYSPARDPVNVAATVASSGRDGLCEGWAAEELARRRRRVAVVDVRDGPETQAGTLAGALSVPLRALRRRLGKLEGRALVFVCDTGRRSYLAARIARQRGVDAAYLSGGLLSWAAEGRPLTPRIGR